MNICFKRGTPSTQNINLNLKDGICCIGSIKFSTIILDNYGIKVKTSINNTPVNLSNLVINDKTINQLNVSFEYDGSLSNTQINDEYDLTWIVICDGEQFTKTQKIIINIQDICNPNDFKTTPEILGTEIIEEEDGNFNFRFYHNKVINASYYKISYCKGLDYTDCELSEDIPNSDNLFIDIDYSLLEECTDYKIKIIALNENKTFLSESQNPQFITTPPKNCECGDTTDLSLLIPNISNSYNTINNTFDIAIQIGQANSLIKEYNLEWRKNNGEWIYYEFNPVSESDLLAGVIEFSLDVNSKYEFRLLACCDNGTSECPKRLWSEILEVVTPNVIPPTNPIEDDNIQNCCSVDEDSISFEEITINSIKVIWDNVPNVDSYRLRFRPKGKGLDWSEIKVFKMDGDTSEVILNNLLPDTIYEFQVKVRCKIKI